MTPVVSVIIPVYNAEGTLSAAMESVLSQTFREIEIIVVDDGSTDRSHAIAQQYAQKDSRATVVRQDNKGVAIARNMGISFAQGSFIAPLDSDDLWHPEKIARQMSRISELDQNVGLVYNWYRLIDKDDIVIRSSSTPRIEGWVLHQHIEWNFVSNGSTPLIRKELLHGIEYRQNLVCEDYLLQLELAKRCKFACAPGFLTGYRKTGVERSADVADMVRSHIDMYRLLELGLEGEARRMAGEKIAAFSIDLARMRLQRGQLWAALDAFRFAIRHSPAGAAKRGLKQMEVVAHVVRRRMAPWPRTAVVGRPFHDVEFDEPDYSWLPRSRVKKLSRLAKMDAQFALRHAHSSQTGRADTF